MPFTPKTKWDADGVVEGVAWWSRLDDKYLVEVQYAIDGDGYQGELCIFDHDDDMKLFFHEPTGISYAARFGADVLDVERWQDRAAEVVDERGSV